MDNIANNTINGYNILNYPADGTKFLTGDVNTTWRVLASSDIPTLTHTKISDFDTQVNTHHPTDLSLCNASFNVNNNNIINLLDPTSSQMAATKNYVDNKFPNITGSTNTKITYNSSGLVTSGSSLLTSDLPYGNSNQILTTNSSGNSAQWSSTIDISNNTTNNLNVNRLTYGTSNQILTTNSSANSAQWSSTIDISNNTTNSLSISRLSGYPNSSAYFLRADGSWVNTLTGNISCGNYNSYAEIAYSTATSTGGNSGFASFYNNNISNQPGIGAGSSCTEFWMPNNSSIYKFCNAVVSGSVLATIDANGNYTKVSDRSLKQSIRQKNPLDASKNYLDRILNLPIYSYAFNFPESSSTSHANNIINVGVMYDDITNTFDGNCINKRKYLSGFTSDNPNPSQCSYRFVSKSREWRKKLFPNP